MSEQDPTGRALGADGDELCPKCRAMPYQGGTCLVCGYTRTDAEELAAAHAALKEPGSVPWAQVKSDLGIAPSPVPPASESPSRRTEKAAEPLAWVIVREDGSYGALAAGPMKLHAGSGERACIPLYAQPPDGRPSESSPKERLRAALKLAKDFVEYVGSKDCFKKPEECLVCAANNTLQDIEAALGAAGRKETGNA